MECNKDEAVRAKEIAEQKFLADDLKGAKLFALKAQNLYPELEGISQMVMTLEVYLSAEEKRNGLSNWYSVLGVPILANDKTIRKQYKKLALLLHPDKNRSIGAEGAFKILSEAWSFLSNNDRKNEYDQKFNAIFAQKNVDPSQPPKQKGFPNFAKASSSQAKVHKGISHKEKQTFWTVCQKCRMHYEFSREYLNLYLLCPYCKEAFHAIETEPHISKVCETVSKRQKAQAAARREEALLRKNPASKRSTDAEFSYNPKEVKRRKVV